MQLGRVLALSAGHFINDMYVGFLAPLLPFIINKLDISLTLAAGLTSILAVFTSLAQPVFGHIADKIRHPFFPILGPLLTACAFGLIGYANSYTALVVIIIFGGIGTAAFHPQSASLVGKTSGRQGGLAMSIFVTGGSAGYYVGPVVIMSIVTWLGLKYSIISIIPGVAVFIILFALLPELPYSPRHHSRINGHFVIPHQYRAILFLFLISVLRSFTISGFNTFIPIYLEKQNVAPMMFAAALTVFGLPGAAGALIAGGLSDRFGRKKIMFASMASALLFLYLFLYFDGILSMVCLGVAGFSMFMSIPVVIITAQELFPGRVNTVSSVVMGFSWGIGGVLVTPLGALAELVGIQTALSLLTGCCALSLIFILFTPETKRVT